MDIKSLQPMPYKAPTTKKKRSREVELSCGRRKFRYQQYTITGTLMKTWDSLLEIEAHGESLNGAMIRNQLVSKCCNGDRNTHGGYAWKKIPYET